jgi:hypothetical protein
VAQTAAQVGQGDKVSRFDSAQDQVPASHAVDHRVEPADGTIGGDQRAVRVTAVAGRRVVDEQPGRDLVDEDGFAGYRRWRPSWLPVEPDLAEVAPGRVLPAQQPHASAISGGLDIQGPTEPGRHGAGVPHQVGDGICVAVDPWTVPTRQCHRVLAHRLHMGRAVDVGR